LSPPWLMRPRRATRTNISGIVGCRLAVGITDAQRLGERPLPVARGGRRGGATGGILRRPRWPGPALRPACPAATRACMGVRRPPRSSPAAGRGHAPKASAPCASRPRSLARRLGRCVARARRPLAAVARRAAIPSPSPPSGKARGWPHAEPPWPRACRMPCWSRSRSCSLARGSGTGSVAQASTTRRAPRLQPECLTWSARAEVPRALRCELPIQRPDSSASTIVETVRSMPARGRLPSILTSRSSRARSA
jgi:hypothetical protein